MNFSEFKRILKSDPGNQDPEFLAARQSAPEFVEAVEESDRFEQQLERAACLNVPEGLTESLKSLAELPVNRASSWPRYGFAMAATVVLAVAAVLLFKPFTPRFDSVESYVVYHYGHDGDKLLQSTGSTPSDELVEILAEFDMQMMPGLASDVRLVKICPTPEGNGIHLVMNTTQGPVTVIVMPGRQVAEGERFAFNGMEATLLNLPGPKASAAIIGQPGQLVPALNRSVQDSLIPLGSGA